MKKFLISFLCMFSFLTLNVKAVEMPEVTDHEKINVYMFRGNGCSACYQTLVWLNENIGEYSDYLNLVTYEVWGNAGNQELLQKVDDKLQANNNSIPFIVVGDSFWAGFSESTAEKILAKVAEEYQNEEYHDLVKEVAKEVDNEEPMTLEEACIEDGIIKGASEGGNDIVVILVIFAVVIGGLTTLVILSRKK